jgi:hypothetical protein
MPTTEFSESLARLERLIATSPRLPAGDLAVVREQELVELLAHLRAAVPASAVRACERRAEIAAIRERASQDADELLQRAHDEVEGLVHDPHLQRDARQRADEALRDAHDKAESIRSAADAFYASTLQAYHERLQDLDVLLERDISALRDGANALTERTAAVAASGGLPLKPESALLAPGAPQIEHHEPPARTEPASGPHSGPNAPTRDFPLE